MGRLLPARDALGQPPSNTTLLGAKTSAPASGGRTRQISKRSKPLNRQKSETLQPWHHNTTRFRNAIAVAVAAFVLTPEPLSHRTEPTNASHRSSELGHRAKAQEPHSGHPHEGLQERPRETNIRPAAQEPSNHMKGDEEKHTK